MREIKPIALLSKIFDGLDSASNIYIHLDIFFELILLFFFIKLAIYFFQIN